MQPTCDEGLQSISSEGCIMKEGSASLVELIKYGHLVGVLGRGILLAISAKKPRVCKLYLFYEMVVLLASQCTVSHAQVDEHLMNTANQLKITLLFCTLYYNFWWSIASVLVY